MMMACLPPYTPGPFATETAEMPIWRHCVDIRFARCGGLAIQRLSAPAALRLGERQTRFSPTDQYE